MQGYDGEGERILIPPELKSQGYRWNFPQLAGGSLDKGTVDNMHGYMYICFNVNTVYAHSMTALEYDEFRLACVSFYIHK